MGTFIAMASCCCRPITQRKNAWATMASDISRCGRGSVRATMV
jgi:hypothetical protein